MPIISRFNDVSASDYWIGYQGRKREERERERVVQPGGSLSSTEKSRVDVLTTGRRPLGDRESPRKRWKTDRNCWLNTDASGSFQVSKFFLSSFFPLSFISIYFIRIKICSRGYRFLMDFFFFLNKVSFRRLELRLCYFLRRSYKIISL